MRFEVIKWDILTVEALTEAIRLSKYDCVNEASGSSDGFLNEIDLR